MIYVHEEQAGVKKLLHSANCLCTQQSIRKFLTVTVRLQSELDVNDFGKLDDTGEKQM